MQRTKDYEDEFEVTPQAPFRCVNVNEFCMRPVQCKETCDAVAMCETIKDDGFRLDKFNGISSSSSWVTFGSLIDEKRSVHEDTKTEFDLATRLSRALEERKERDEDSPSDTSAPPPTTPSATPRAPPKAPSAPPKAPPSAPTTPTRPAAPAEHEPPEPKDHH
jgi:hypothetical protein